SLGVLVGVVVVVVLIAWLLWRPFIKVYSQAQSALRETFATPREPHHPEPRSPDTIIKGAQIEIMTLPQDSPCIGRLIRELTLRAETGASIVALDRGGDNMVNPSPEEELKAGDRLFLIGNRAQLAAARKHLSMSGD